MRTLLAGALSILATVVGLGHVGLWVGLWVWSSQFEPLPEHLPTGDAAFQNLINERVYVGQRREHAVATLMAVGLECRSNVSLGTIAPIEFCAFFHKGPIIHRFWKVMLEIDGDKVTDVRSSIELTVL